MVQQQSDNTYDVIYGRRDVSVNIRNSAWFLFEHELAKSPECKETILAAVLLWMDEQRALLSRRRLEPTIWERQILAMLICDGLTMKQIALRTGKKLDTTKKHVKRMRVRLGNLTLYQLVALSVLRGWVLMNREE